MGIKGEEDCGPVGVYDASWAVNKNASEKDKKATLDFIKWMITDNEAKKILSKDMGFSVPFTTFTDDYQPDNPLTEAARAYSNDGKTEVRSFTIPDQQWQDDIASALVEYTQGTGKWDKVQSAFVDGWSTEWTVVRSAAVHLVVMKVSLQRVTEASAIVLNELGTPDPTFDMAQIGPGLVLTIEVEPDDDEGTLARMAHRVLTLRCFDGPQGRLSLSVQVMFLCVKDGSAPACASVTSPTVPSNSHCRNDRNACRHGFQNVDHPFPKHRRGMWHSGH